MFLLSYFRAVPNIDTYTGTPKRVRAIKMGKSRKPASRITLRMSHIFSSCGGGLTFGLGSGSCLQKCINMAFGG